MAKVLNVGFGAQFGSSGVEGMSKQNELVNSIVADVAPESSGKVKMDYVQYDDLVRYEKNRTNDNESIDELVNSILRNGFITSITVRKQDNKYVILSGHRRWRAFGKILESDPQFNNRKLPAIIVPADMNDKKAREMNIRLNLDAEDLSPKEKREAILELISIYETEDGKLSQEAAELVAKKLHKTAVTIYNYRKVQKNLCPELASLLNDGSISDTDALNYCKLNESNQLLVFNTLLTKDPRKGKVKLDQEEMSIIKETDKAEKEAEDAAKLNVNEIKKQLAEAQSSNGEEVEQLKTKLEESQKELELVRKREYEAKSRNRADRNIIKKAREAVKNETASLSEKQSVILATDSYINDIAKKVNQLAKATVGIELEESQKESLNQLIEKMQSLLSKPDIGEKVDIQTGHSD